MYVFGHRIKYYSLLLYDVHVEALLSYESYKLTVALKLFWAVLKHFLSGWWERLEKGCLRDPARQFDLFVSLRQRCQK